MTRAKGLQYLIDTDWLVEALQGKAEAKTLLTSLSKNGKEELAISLITYGEIYEGIYYGNDPTKHERVFLSFLRGVKVLLLNRSIMKEFSRIRGELRAKDKLIGDMDTLIAASAITNNLTLVSRNVKHFKQVPGLSLYNYGHYAHSQSEQAA